MNQQNFPSNNGVPYSDYPPPSPDQQPIQIAPPEQVYQNAYEANLQPEKSSGGGCLGCLTVTLIVFAVCVFVTLGPDLLDQLSSFIPTQTTQSTSTKAQSQNGDASQAIIVVDADQIRQSFTDWENQVIESARQYGVNQHGEPLSETIIYSDEYTAFYCSVWSALQAMPIKQDPLFETYKMRWQIDYTNQAYVDRLVNAYETGGIDALNAERNALLHEVVNVDVLAERWRNGE